MTMWIKRHQIYSFFILAFAISWAIWIPVILFVSKDGEFHPLLYIGGYGPFLSAVLVTWIAEGGHGLRQWLKRTFRWRIHILWFLIYVGGLSIITTWLYFKSSMSVIPLMLFHQGTNHISNYFPMPTDVLPGLTDWVVLTAIVYWITAIVLLVATKGRLGHSGTAHD